MHYRAILKTSRLGVNVGTGTFRNSWSFDQRYFLKATVILSGKPQSLSGKWTDSSILVFEADEKGNFNSLLFMSHYQNHTIHIEDELDEAERVGHAFIASRGRG
jgi:hypothetical protein